MFSALPSIKSLSSHVPGTAASHSSAHEASNEPSLTTILSSAQSRTDFTLLLASITDDMRTRLDSCFSISTDSNPDSLVSSEQQQQQRYQQAVAAKKTTGKDDDGRAWVDFVQSDIAAQEKVKQELEKRRQDLSSERITAMRRACSAGFDHWRERVLMRVGEVVNRREGNGAGSEENTIRHETPDKASGSRGFVTGKEQDEKVAEVQDSAAVKAALAQAYPPAETELSESLSEAQKALVLHATLLLLLSLEQYSAWSRVLLLRLTSSLGLPVKLLVKDERDLAEGLLKVADAVADGRSPTKDGMSANESTKKAADDNAFSRKWKVGLATVAGAAVVGITGGLAAPLLAAGVGSVMGGLGLGATATAGYLGTLAGSSVLVGGLFGAYGGKMTGEMMDQYAKEVEDFAFVPIHGPKSGREKPSKDKDTAASTTTTTTRRLRVTLGISGWLTQASDVDQPWAVLDGTSSETFALRFELKALLALGNALSILLRSTAWSYAKSEIIKRTVLASLTAALWPLALLKVSRVIDNPFSVAKTRADKAGEVLADAIINKAQGERPVSLVGYSLGARVAYVCLKKLAERNAFGLVEDVVLIGAPTPSDELDWRVVRAVAAGRVVNVYSTEDYILGFLYRTSSVQLGIAGLQRIENVPGVESVDFSEHVQGHTAWRFSVGRVLQRLGIDDLDAAEVERQVALGKREKKDEDNSRAEAEGSSDPAGKADPPTTAEISAQKLQNEVDEKNKDAGVTGTAHSKND